MIEFSPPLSKSPWWWPGRGPRWCTDRLLIYNDHQATAVLAENTDHYTIHRPHQLREQRAPNDEDWPRTVAPDAPIQRHSVVRGLLNE